MIFSRIPRVLCNNYEYKVRVNHNLVNHSTVVVAVVSAHIMQLESDLRKLLLKWNHGISESLHGRKEKEFWERASSLLDGVGYPDFDAS